MASPTRWTLVWVHSGSWWWTGRPGVLWFMGSQRVGHDWATELNWTAGAQGSIPGWETKIPQSVRCGFKKNGKKNHVTSRDTVHGIWVSSSTTLVWHQWLNGHEFEQAPGVGDGQGNLACCSPWSWKELDTTERLNWTELVRLSRPTPWQAA